MKYLGKDPTTSTSKFEVVLFGASAAGCRRLTKFERPTAKIRDQLITN